MESHAYAVILAGGSGERFWPLSTKSRPKQFVSVFGGKPLIRHAVDRLEGLVPPERVLIVTSADLAEAIGKPGSHRSIGTAIRQVKLAPFVPAHRVLAANATGKRARIFRAFQAIEARACGRADRNP